MYPPLPTKRFWSSAYQEHAHELKSESRLPTHDRLSFDSSILVSLGSSFSNRNFHHALESSSSTTPPKSDYKNIPPRRTTRCLFDLISQCCYMSSLMYLVVHLLMSSQVLCTTAVFSCIPTLLPLSMLLALRRLTMTISKMTAKLRGFQPSGLFLL